MNLYFIDLTKCKFIVWVQIYCTPNSVVIGFTQKYCTLSLTMGPIPISFHWLCWLYNLVDILTQIFWAFLSWHRFSSWNMKMGSISNLDAKMLLHERAVIHKRAKILQSAIFLHLVDFIHKRKKKQVNKAMQVQKYCLFCDFQLSLIKLVTNVSWQLWSSHTQVDLLTIT